MKRFSKKTWIAGVTLVLLLLFSFFIFRALQNRDLGFLQWLWGMTPAPEEIKTDFDTVLAVAASLLDTGGVEKTFLILFQNNLELRPGGGFIGSFGILKVKDGQITHFAVHDTGNFDGRIPDTFEPPYPMRETLKIGSWKLRDSNYSPDFPENAKWAETFYRLGEGAEPLDGIVAITTNVLSTVLEITGPVAVPGYPGTYDAQNAVFDLEYQVEQGYRDQAIDFGERKSFMGVLGSVLIGKIKELPLQKKYELFRAMLDDLHQKDIQLSFRNGELEHQIVKAGWSGRMDNTWDSDYLFVVDANLGAYKSDLVVKRSYDYTIDLSQARPKATLRVHYQHTGKEKNWFTNDYQSFLRVYVPKGSYLERAENTRLEPVFGEFSSKKYFGALIQVALNSEKTITFEYLLPEGFDKDGYDLMIQKQAGLNEVPVQVKIIRKDGKVIERNFPLNRDTILSEIEN